MHPQLSYQNVSCTSLPDIVLNNQIRIALHSWHNKDYQRFWRNVNEVVQVCKQPRGTTKAYLFQGKKRPIGVPQATSSTS